MNEVDRDTPSAPARRSEPAFCPECGQPLTLTRHRHESSRSGMVTWRSIVLLGMGLYLTAAFGLGAWRANQEIQAAISCSGATAGQRCGPVPRDLTLMIATQRMTTGDAFAFRNAELSVGRDLRFASVGLAGLALGLGALVLRAKRSHQSYLRFVSNLWLAAEALVALFFGQVAVLTMYRLLTDAPNGDYLSWDALFSAVDQTLSTFFALTGIS